MKRNTLIAVIIIWLLIVNIPISEGSTSEYQTDTHPTRSEQNYSFPMYKGDMQRTARCNIDTSDNPGMLILEYSGLLNEYIEFRLNLLGIATSEQTMDALEKVQSEIMDISSAKQTFLYTIESPRSYYELERKWFCIYGTTFKSEFGCNASEYDSSFVCVPLMPHVPGQRGFFKAMWGKDHDNMIVYQAKRFGIL